MIISILSIAVNYVMNSLLVGPFGHVGLAFSTSSVALVNFILLAIFMGRRLGGLRAPELIRSLVRISGAAIPLAVVAWITSEVVSQLSLGTLAFRFINVVISIALASVAFYWSCRALKIAELDDAINAIAGRFFRLARRQ